MTPGKATPTDKGLGASASKGLAVGAAVGCLAGVVVSAFNPFFVDSLWLGLLALWAAPAALGAAVWCLGHGLGRLRRGRPSAASPKTPPPRSKAAWRRTPVVLFLLALVVTGLYVARHLNERAPSKNAAAPHVLVIGLDGATWDIMDPMMERGELPNLAALRKSGASGVLTSEEPTLSPAVWSTIATGKHRDKHGVMDFTYTQEDLRVPRIWELLEGEGKTVGMMCWLVTWPPAVRNGFMVPGWLARTPETYPPNLHFAQDIILGEGLARTPREYLAYIVDAPRIGVRMSTLFDALRLVAFSKLTKPPMLDLVSRKEMLKGKIYSDIFCWLLVNYGPDFAAVVFYGTDSLAHVYWKYMEAADTAAGVQERPPAGAGTGAGAERAPAPRGWDVSDEDAARYGDVIRDYYRLADSFLPRILSLVPEETTVCVVSDHGHGPSGSDWGYLVIRATRLIETLGLAGKVSVASVGDWSFLSAAPRTGPDGLAEAVEVLSSLKVARNGMPFLGLKVKASATLSLRIADGVEPTDEFSVPGGGTYKVSDFVDKAELSGTHRLEGVIILSGPAVKKGCEADSARLVDVTPTLLYLMGSTVGEDMDGAVLTECLQNEFLERNPIRTVASRDGEVKLPGATGGHEMPESLKKRLRELGYVK